MPIVRFQANWFSASGNGYHTIDINIPPSEVTAQATLHGAHGAGTQYTGIKHIRKRLPSGADQDIDFGGWPSWPPLIFDRVSSVTYAIATAGGQSAWMLGRMDFWG
jgi:hypothetical protein